MALIIQALFIVAIIGATSGLVYCALHILAVVPIFTVGDPIDASTLTDEDLDPVPLPAGYLEEIEQRRAQPIWPRLWPPLLGALSLLVFLACAYMQASTE
jgi:hypothetical protein